MELKSAQRNRVESNGTELWPFGLLGERVAVMPSPFTRALSYLGFRREEGDGPGWLPPARRNADSYVSPRRALTLSTVYRAVSIDATAACQLSAAVWRNDLMLSKTPSLIAKPDMDESRSAFFEYTVVSLRIDGNAFWLLTRADPTSPRAGDVVDCKPLNPHEVAVYRDPATDKVTFGYRGKTYDETQIKHLKLLRVPGMERGLGPIQAAQVELNGSLEARDYGNKWLSESEQPDGILSTEQELKPGDTETYKNIWYGRNPDGSEKTDPADASKPAKRRNRRERLRVLGKGLTYTPLLLKPADLQFLETQKFNTTGIARLFGMPASLMLAAIEGKSGTYQNVEQEWIGYIRFGLMLALREIEEALTDLLPYGQSARFKLDVLLRSDTKTRYEGHQIALNPESGWMDVDEVRVIEGLPPLTEEQRARRAAAAKTKESTNAAA